MPGQDRGRSRSPDRDLTDGNELEGFRTIKPSKPELEGEKWRKRIESELDELEDEVRTASEKLDRDGGLDEKWDRLDFGGRRDRP